MANGSGMRQHQSMARSNTPVSGNSFGCDSLSSVNGNFTTNAHPAPEATKYGTQGALLGDHERAGPPLIGRGGGKMGAMAHSDHGPHNLHPQQHGS